MASEMHLELSSNIQDINYELNKVERTTDGRLLGYDCELEVALSCGIMYLNYENTDDLKKTIDKLQDILSIWKRKEETAYLAGWIKR